MKEKILTTISTLMIFVPWTILPLRSFPWALESPVAEIMISCYAAFMIFSGVFYAGAYSAYVDENSCCNKWNLYGGRDCCIFDDVSWIGISQIPY